MAFNSIDWYMLIDLPKIKRFGAKWCSWISNILFSIKIALLINGETTRWIKTNHELKQGDPLIISLPIHLSDRYS